MTNRELMQQLLNEDADDTACVLVMGRLFEIDGIADEHAQGTQLGSTALVVPALRDAIESAMKEGK